MRFIFFICCFSVVAMSDIVIPVLLSDEGTYATYENLSEESSEEETSEDKSEKEVEKEQLVNDYKLQLQNGVKINETLLSLHLSRYANPLLEEFDPPPEYLS